MLIDTNGDGEYDRQDPDDDRDGVDDMTEIGPDPQNP